jgi:hypothetical protein
MTQALYAHMNNKKKFKKKKKKNLQSSWVRCYMPVIPEFAAGRSPAQV